MAALDEIELLCDPFLTTEEVRSLAGRPRDDREFIDHPAGDGGRLRAVVDRQADVRADVQRHPA